MTNVKLLLDKARGRLERVAGSTRASQILEEVMRELGLEDVNNSHDLLRVSVALMKRPGLIKCVGQSLKAHAELLGATSQERQLGA